MCSLYVCRCAHLQGTNRLKQMMLSIGTLGLLVHQVEGALMLLGVEEDILSTTPIASMELYNR